MINFLNYSAFSLIMADANNYGLEKQVPNTIVGDMRKFTGYTG